MAAYISFQPSDFFNTKLYTGTGSSNAITGVGFQPALLGLKLEQEANPIDFSIVLEELRNGLLQIILEYRLQLLKV